MNNLPTLYTEIDPETRVFLQGKEQIIKSLVANTIIEIGAQLREAKERVGHGNFQRWIQECFGMSKVRAWEYMKIEQAFKSSPGELLENVHKKALLLLSSTSLPEEIREEVKEQVLVIAETGEKVTLDTVKDLIREKKEAQEEAERVAEELKNARHYMTGQNEKVREKLNETAEELERLKQEKTVEVEKVVPPPDYDKVKAMNRDLRKKVDDQNVEISGARFAANKAAGLAALEQALAIIEKRIEEIKYLQWFDIPEDLRHTMKNCGPDLIKTMTRFLEK